MNISDNDLRFIFSYLDPQYHSDELTEHENLGDNFESKWESKQDEETEVRIRVHIGSSLTASNESALKSNLSLKFRKWFDYLGQCLYFSPSSASP